MKKIFLIIALCLPMISVNAQNEDKEKTYLPEKGDMAIGVNLHPVFNYVGNMFNGTTDNKIEDLGGEPVSKGLAGYDSSIAPDVSIMWKYMFSDKFALRANLGMMLGNDTSRGYVVDDNALMQNPFDQTKLIDSKRESRNGMSLMVGTEFRKGKKRVQGVFGAGLLFGFMGEKTTYNYANAMTTVNQNPSTAWDVYNKGYRTLTKKTDGNVFIGITGSAGVEWFVAPKIALGAEVNLSMYSIYGGQQYVESEGYNSSTKKIENRCDLTSPGDNKFRFGTDNLGGALYMAFYF